MYVPAAEGAEDANVLDRKSFMSTVLRYTRVAGYKTHTLTVMSTHKQVTIHFFLFDQFWGFAGS